MVWVVTREHKILGVFTTRIVESGIRWVLVCDLAGEHMDEWLLEAQHALEVWARELGAVQIVIEGRRGWERALRPFGYEPTHTICIKTLEVLQ